VNQKNPQITLVCSLGAGDEKRFGEWRYAEVEFELHGEKAPKMPLLAAALCELIPRVRHDGAKVDRVVLLGTAKVEEIWIKSGLLRRALPSVDIEFVTTPEGKNTAENWEIFDALLTALGAGEDEPAPGHIYLEVTHGFRSLPLLGAAALNYALSEWSRRQIKHPPRVSIVYGAWEAKASGGGTPVWDMTDLVTSSRWNSAIDAFVRRGDAEELDRVVASTGTVEGEAAIDPDKVIDALRAIGADLSLGRLRDLFTGSAPALIAALDSPAVTSLVERMPPLGPSVAWLREAIAPLQAGDVVGPDGLRATLAFANLSSDHGRFSDAAAALREAIVTTYGQRTRRTRMVEPGARGYKKQRERLEAELDGLRRGLSEGSDEERAAFAASLDPSLREAFAQLDPLAKVQFDLAHLGLGPDSSSAAVLREEVRLRWSQTAALAAQRPEGSLFVNLSATPVASWSPEQIEAVRALGLGEAVELLGGLPEIDPDAEPEQIEAQARLLAARAIAQGAAGAHVATDASLAFALVAELQARGVRCFAATTRKVAAPGETTPVARFARWREFARPSDDEN
jgi:CRISPR-associated DxTHG motif protein